MKITYPKRSTLTLEIDRFDAGINTSKDAALTPLNYAINIENFAFGDGALKDGVGFADLAAYISPEDSGESLRHDFMQMGSIEKVFYFYKYNAETNEREDKLIFANTIFQLFYIDMFSKDKSLKSLRGVTFTTEPVAVRYRLNGEDVIIFSSETDNMVVWNGIDAPYTVLDAPHISSMALHYERLFATVDKEKSAVWFSDDLDPTNWSLSLEEAGFIELIDERGALLKVVSFCDYVYIFREYGISRLTAYADQTNFAVSNLFVSSGKIYPSSVCVCGDRIMFLAEDGLYSFDGINTSRVLSGISQNFIGIDNQRACACYGGGNYYLACKFRFMPEDVIEDAMLVVDLGEMKLSCITRGVEVKYLCALSEQGIVVAIATDDAKNAFSPTIICKNASFLGKSLKKVWQSARTKVGSFAKACLSKLTLYSKGDVTLVIHHDGEDTPFEFSGSTRQQIKRLNIDLYDFSFTIEAGSESDIKHLCFEFSSAKAYF